MQPHSQKAARHALPDEHNLYKPTGDSVLPCRRSGAPTTSRRTGASHPP